MMPRAVRLASVYAVAGWAAITGLLIAAGDFFVPAAADRFAPLVVLALGAATGVAVAAISVDFLRRVDSAAMPAALVLATCIASIGLALDAALLLAREFRYPNVEGSKQSTLLAALLLGYAVAAAVPPLVARRQAAQPPRSARGKASQPG